MEISSNTIKCEAYEDDGLGNEEFYERFWIANSIFITTLLCENEATLDEYDTTVGVTSAVELSYELCAPFPTGGYFVLQLPKLDQEYQSFGAITLTSMFPNSLTSSSALVTAVGQIYSASLSIESDVTVLEEDALGVATHSANGLTYD